MRFDGTLTSWNDERGFGHIQAAGGGELVFMHISAWPRGRTRPQVGQAVSFEIESGPRGKRAKNIQLSPIQHAQRRATRSGPVQRGGAALLIIPAFAVVYMVAAVMWRPPLWIAGAYLILSVIAFAAYARDKAAAEGDNWRTPESTLHLLALAGGWPGAMLAQQFLRHKSVKREFRRVFWTTVVLNVVAILWLISPAGNHLLPSS